MLTRIFVACVIAASLVAAQPGMPGPMGAGGLGGIGSPMGGVGSPLGGAVSPLGGVGSPLGGAGPTPFSTLAALVAASTGTNSQPMPGQLVGSLTNFLPQAGATGVNLPSMMAPSATAAPAFSASSAAPFTTTAAPTMPLGQLNNQNVLPGMTGLPAQSAQSLLPTMTGLPNAQSVFPTPSGVTGLPTTMPTLGVNVQAANNQALPGLTGVGLPDIQHAFNTAAAAIPAPMNNFVTPSATGNSAPAALPTTATGLPTFQSTLPIASTNSVLPSATGMPTLTGALPNPTNGFPAVSNNALPVVTNSALPAAGNAALPAAQSGLPGMPGAVSTTAGGLPITSSLPTLPASTSLPATSSSPLAIPTVSQAPVASTVPALNGAPVTTVQVPAPLI